MTRPRASQAQAPLVPTTEGFTDNGLPVGPHGIPEPTLPPRGGAAYRIRKRELATPYNTPATIVPVNVDGYSAARVQ